MRFPAHIVHPAPRSNWGRPGRGRFQLTEQGCGFALACRLEFGHNPQPVADGGRYTSGCGRSSGVEHHLAKVRVGRSNRLARSNFQLIKEFFRDRLPVTWRGTRGRRAIPGEVAGRSGASSSLLRADLAVRICLPNCSPLHFRSCGAFRLPGRLTRQAARPRATAPGALSPFRPFAAPPRPQAPSSRARRRRGISRCRTARSYRI